MVVDYTITVGNIIEIATIVGGGFMFLNSLKNTVGNLKKDVAGMQDEIKKIGQVLIQMAVTTTRLDNHDREISELKHGRGFIREAIDREYP
ncbi:MAG: hypothetical protein J0G33_02600 [Afipia felis]|nr:hypothetical protein [Afipia felis]